MEPHRFERGFGFGARQAVGAGARQFAPPRGLVDVGGTQRIGLDAGLVEQGKPSRRTGGKNEFGTAKHAGLLSAGGSFANSRGTYRKVPGETTTELTSRRPRESIAWRGRNETRRI